MEKVQVYLLEAQPSQSERLICELRTLADRLDAEPGCLATEIFADTDSPGKVIFLERWQSEQVRADAGARLGKDAFKAVMQLLAAPPDVRSVRAARTTADRPSQRGSGDEPI